MYVKVPASLTEEVIKAQIKTVNTIFFDWWVGEYTYPSILTTSSIDMCSKQYQRERLRELQQTCLVELQKYLV